MSTRTIKESATERPPRFHVVNVLLASGEATLGYWNGARWWVIGDRDGDVKKWTELLHNVSATGGKPDFQFEVP